MRPIEFPVVERNLGSGVRAMGKCLSGCADTKLVVILKNLKIKEYMSSE